MSVEDVQAATDSHQFALWEAFQRIEASGEWKADVRAAMIATVIQNVNCMKTGDAMSMRQFLRILEPNMPRSQTDPAQSEARMMAWANRHNARKRGES